MKQFCPHFSQTLIGKLLLLWVSISLLAACGAQPASSITAPTATTVPTEQSPIGDVPDNAVFVTYTTEDGGYSIQYVEGWTINRDDVRRVVANWPEYGGIVFDHLAKTRPAYEKLNVEEIPFNSDRAVFPIQLLRSVAEVRQGRTRRPTNDGYAQEKVDFEAEKREAIALCRRRIDAAATLYGDGMIDREEYKRRVEMNQRDIAHWEARTSETEKMALELGMSIEILDKIILLWDGGSDENRQGLARNIFEAMVYDLNTQRIVSFRLKSWANRYLKLRAELNKREIGEKEHALFF